MRTVLCVSHEWNLRFADLRALADAGFSIATATSGRAALKLISQREITAVLLNRRLPDMDVQEFARQIKAREPMMPVIMLSPRMHAADEAGNCIDAVMSCHLTHGLLVPTLQVLLTTPAEIEIPPDVVPFAA